MEERWLCINNLGRDGVFGIVRVHLRFIRNFCPIVHFTAEYLHGIGDILFKECRGKIIVSLSNPYEINLVVPLGGIWDKDHLYAIGITLTKIHGIRNSGSVF